MTVFVDTGAFLARYIAADQHYSVAGVIWKRLAGSTIWTSSHVLDETFTLLGRRAGYDFAADRAHSIYSSSAVQILYNDREDDLTAIRLFRKFADLGVSFTDCLSFALMKRNKLTTAFTFDSHFQLAGFEILQR